MATNSDDLRKLESCGDDAPKKRRELLEQRTGADLVAIGKGILKPSGCKANIENMIGCAQLPIGVAGPIKVGGEYAKGDFFIPLATTEGALVASVNRGCNAITASGGSSALIVKEGQTRSILFSADSLGSVNSFLSYLSKNNGRLRKAGEEGEPYIKVLDIVPYVVGLNVWLRVSAMTGDAMGMNMVTIAAKKIAEAVDVRGIKFISESGNLCVDKKPSGMGLIESRGRRVVASVSLKEAVVKEILKTDSASIVDMCYRKNLLGSAASGSLGYNAHFANIIAALFIATGQDAAHTVDGALGFTLAEKTDEGLDMTVTLTSLHVGTVGGGTGLPTQKECLSLLGVAGPSVSPGENARKLSEIAASAVLAGELSLLAALCSKDLAKAHIAHNR